MIPDTKQEAWNKKLWLLSREEALSLLSHTHTQLCLSGQSQQDTRVMVTTGQWKMLSASAVDKRVRGPTDL